MMSVADETERVNPVNPENPRDEGSGDDPRTNRQGAELFQGQDSKEVEFYLKRLNDRLTLQEVRPFLDRQKRSDMFGPYDYGSDVVVTDIFDNPTLKFEVGNAQYQELLEGPLKNSGKDARQVVREALTKTNAAEISKAAKNSLHTHRYLVDTFDGDISAYPLNLRLERMDPEGYVKLEDPDQIVDQILASFKDKMMSRFQFRQRNHLERQLLRRGLKELEPLINKTNGMVDTLLSWELSDEPEKAAKVRQRSEEYRNAGLDAASYERMRDALQKRLNVLESIKVQEEEEKIETHRKKNNELLDNDAIMEMMRKNEVSVPICGINDHFEDMVQKKIWANQRNKTLIWGARDGQVKIQKFLRTCAQIIHGELTPGQAFQVMLELSDPDGPFHKIIRVEYQSAVQNGEDLEGALKGLWYNLQAQGNSRTSEIRREADIIRAMTKPTEYAHDMQQWLLEVYGHVMELYEGKSISEQVIYSRDTLREVMEETMNIWWGTNLPTFLLFERDWESIRPVRKAMDYVTAWTNTCQQKQKEMRTPKAAVPVFKSQSRWVALARDYYTRTHGKTDGALPAIIKRRAMSESHQRNAPKSTTGRVNAMGLSPNGPYRTASANLAAKYDPDARSTQSNNPRTRRGRGTRGEFDDRCRKCGNLEHLYNNCDMYGGTSRYRTDSRCPECTWWHDGRCLGDYKTYNQRHAQVNTVEDVDDDIPEDALTLALQLDAEAEAEAEAAMDDKDRCSVTELDDDIESDIEGPTL